MPVLRRVAVLLAALLALAVPPARADVADHGALLTATDITGQPNVGIAHAGTVERISYRTTGVDGGEIDALATVFLPESRTAAPLRVLAFTHGTAGVGADCTVGTRMGTGGGYDAWLGPWLAAGYAVVVPEYGGIGTTGHHPYLNGEATARTVLDAVRATRQVPAAGAVGDEFAVWGGSQGGHTAVWTDDLAPSYTPDLRLVGAIAGSLPADVAGSFNVIFPGLPAVPGTSSLVAYAGYVLAGLENDGVDLSTFSELSSAGRQFVATAQTQCYRQLSTTTVAPGSLVTRPLLGSALVREIATRTALPTTPLPGKVLVQQGAFDIVAPATATSGYVLRQTAHGADVDYQLYAADHGLNQQAATDAFNWAQRLPW